jgi:hypothetical protein
MTPGRCPCPSLTRASWAYESHHAPAAFTNHPPPPPTGCQPLRDLPTGPTARRHTRSPACCTPHHAAPGRLAPAGAAVLVSGRAYRDTGAMGIHRAPLARCASLHQSCGCGRWVAEDRRPTLGHAMRSAFRAGNPRRATAGRASPLDWSDAPRLRRHPGHVARGEPRGFSATRRAGGRGERPAPQPGGLRPHVLAPAEAHRVPLVHWYCDIRALPRASSPRPALCPSRPVHPNLNYEFATRLLRPGDDRLYGRSRACS